MHKIYITYGVVCIGIWDDWDGSGLEEANSFFESGTRNT